MTQNKLTINKFNGRHAQVKGQDQKSRGKQIANDLTVLQGSTLILMGTLQEVYDMTKEEAEKNIREYEL